MADREMDTADFSVTLLCGGVECSFHEVLFSGCARRVAIAVEKEQTLGQVAVVHIFQQVADSFFALFSLQTLPESEEVFIRKERTHKFCFFAGIEVSIEVFEHTACRSRSRNKLGHLVALTQVFLPEGYVTLSFCNRGTYDTFLVPHGSGCNYIQFWKSCAEPLQLLFRLTESDPSLLQLSNVVRRKNRCFHINYVYSLVVFIPLQRGSDGFEL